MRIGSFSVPFKKQVEVSIEMKRILCITVALLICVSAFVSCAPKIKFETLEYKENGICLYLPDTLKRKEVEGYELYFLGKTSDVLLTASKLDEEKLSAVGLKSDATAEAYVDAIIEKNQFDKEKLYYQYDEELEQYNFRYNYNDEMETDMFFYVTVLGDPGNIWYIEMCCDTSKSTNYLSTFESWRRGISVYN